MRFKVQRFEPGHKFYSDKFTNNAKAEQGVVGAFQSVFGQLVNAEDGSFICYTLERADTLISEGTRKYKLYDSPKNRCRVLLFEDEPGSGTYDRKFELHPANWCFQLKGCTSVGDHINTITPMILNSRNTFNLIMAIAGKEGTITHQILKQQIT